MRTRFVSIMIVLVLLVSLMACGKAADQSSDASVLSEPKGVDSVKTLMEISLDYFHNNRDYSVIADYQDPQANLAFILLSEYYADREMSFDDAMEIAACFYKSADELQQKDPNLVAMLLEEMNVQDTETFINNTMMMLRENLQNDVITSENPDYDKISQMLADWDKGTDYILENYPELLEDARRNGVVFNLEDAMERMRRTAHMELYRNSDEDAIFSKLECEYKPENTYVNPIGLCFYDMGAVIDGGAEWSIDIIYYVKDELYYLVGYDYLMSGIGG